LFLDEPLTSCKGMRWECKIVVDSWRQPEYSKIFSSFRRKFYQEEFFIYIWEASKVKREWKLIISNKILSRDEDTIGE
jgi:hypothetical protein